MSIDDHPSDPPVIDQKNLASSSEPSRVLAASDISNEDVDIYMTDWISDSPPSLEASLIDRTEPADLPFDFHIETVDEIDPGNFEGDPPVSPRETAWDWPARSIGRALTTPGASLDTIMWDVQPDGRNACLARIDHEAKGELGTIDRRATSI